MMYLPQDGKFRQICRGAVCSIVILIILIIALLIQCRDCDSILFIERLLNE